MVVYSSKTTFQYAPKSFDIICISIAVYILSVAVVNDIMFVQFMDCLISLPFIRIKRCSALYVTKDRNGKGFIRSVAYNLANQLPATL